MIITATQLRKEAANGDTVAEDDGAGTSCLGAVFVAGEDGVAPPPLPEAGDEDDEDGGVESSDPASTFTSSFMPPLQWPITEQMK